MSISHLLYKNLNEHTHLTFFKENGCKNMYVSVEGFDHAVVLRHS